MEWFPDRKGIASGLTIAGFGSGSLIAVPVFGKLSQAFATLPEYLGTRDSVATQTQNGKLFADVAGQLKEVVIATSTRMSLLTVWLTSAGVACLCLYEGGLPLSASACVCVCVWLMCTLSPPPHRRGPCEAGPQAARGRVRG